MSQCSSTYVKKRYTYINAITLKREPMRWHRSGAGFRLATVQLIVISEEIVRP